MTQDSLSIKINSIEFMDPAFRKLRNLKVKFADRITIVAGHNGIGKSTILGLVANSFGLTDKAGPKSYFGDAFFTNIERIVYLGLDEVAKAKEHPTSAPIVEADFDGNLIRKRCALTQRDKWKRARVVPRTIEPTETDPVGPDAKFPLPLIFLGVRRLASAGEAHESDVALHQLEMADEDKELMVAFVRSVIVGTEVNNNVTHHTIKGSQKKTAHPGYASHDALTVSMGQDSLGSIATAFASFNRLQRELGDSYAGGILVIDEIDVGFHPHAIDRLVESIKTQAKRLRLQVICTTHSPRLIEAVHPDGLGSSKAPDSVVYLVDTRHPRLAEDQSLSAIIQDMSLRVELSQRVPQTKVLCVYFEDEEGAQFCDALISSRKRSAVGRKYGVRIKLVPLGVGGSNLLGLPDKDPIFLDRILIVDADTSIPKKVAQRGNALKLPCVQGSGGTNRSPENTIKNFLRAVSAADAGPLYDAMLRLRVSNPSSDKIEATFFSTNESQSNQRTSSKNWWTAHWENLEEWQVIQEWSKCYPAESSAFLSQFEDAVAQTSKRLK